MRVGLLALDRPAVHLCCPGLAKRLSSAKAIGASRSFLSHANGRRPAAPGRLVCLPEAHVHEAGIADRILDMVIARATEAGVLAGVSEEELRFHWEQHAAGTPAEGATLHLAQTDEPTDLRLASIDVDDGETSEP